MIVELKKCDDLKQQGQHFSNALSYRLIFDATIICPANEKYTSQVDKQNWDNFYPVLLFGNITAVRHLKCQ